MNPTADIHAGAAGTNALTALRTDPPACPVTPDETGDMHALTNILLLLGALWLLPRLAIRILRRRARPTRRG